MSRARASSSASEGPLTIEMPTSGLVIVADKDKPRPTRRKRAPFEGAERWRSDPPDGRADELREVTLETDVNRYAEGSCLVSFGHTRVLVTASLDETVPGFPARPRPGLGDGRVRHAAPGHPHPRPARGGGGQAVRPQPGDPAPDRPLAARRHRPEGAGRAPVHPRLRRDPGRRRHPHRRDHRRLGGAAAGHALAAGRGRDQGRPDPRPVAAISCGVYRTPRCSTSTTRRTPAPRPTPTSC